MGEQHDRGGGRQAALHLFNLRSGLVLLVTYFFHPLDALPIKMFNHGNMRHGRSRRGAVPMLLIRRAADHVSWPNFFDRASPALYEAAASRHDQGLAERVSVPRSPRAGLEC